MIKGADNKGCFSKYLKPKKRYSTSDAAIEKAKELNAKSGKINSKLVAYKCTSCHQYHLTTVFKQK